VTGLGRLMMRICRGAVLALVLTGLAVGCSRGTATSGGTAEVPKVQEVKATKLQMPDVGKPK